MADQEDFDTETAAVPILAEPPALSRSMTPTGQDEPACGQLLVLAGAQTGKRIPIRGDTVVGRAPSADICLPDPHISRQHVRIWQEPDDSYRLQDLGSHNGTAINGQPVDRSPHPIRFGDKIRIGRSSLLLFSRYDNMEEQLLQSQKLEALGQLAGGVAHDFNNLLAVILGNVGVVRTYVQGREALECLDDIETAANRAAGLTRQLLNFSTRKRSGQRLVDVSKLTEEAAELARRTFDSAISISDEIAPGLNVKGDAAELHQVLMNLLVNARDAMPRGGQLEIALRRAGQRNTDSAGEIAFAQLVVADSGVGMDEEVRQRAFEPFYTTKPKGDGSGLGLSTVYGIVQKHGGRVTLESAVNKGTTLRVWLPLTEAGGDTALQATAALGRPAKRAGLVVDSQLLVLNTVARLVRAVGFEPLAASSAAEALQLLRERRADIQFVLVETQVRDAAGQPAFWALQKASPETPLVIMSGQDRDDRAQEMLSAGASYFLQKPFGKAALDKALDHTLGLDISALDAELKDSK